MDKDSYLLELSRYVVLNPVRAGMAATAADWRWSSYLAVMGKAPQPTWLAVEDTLALLHRQRGPARRAYARFVTEGLQASDPIAHPARSGFIGNDAFVERVQAQIDTGTLSREIPRKARPAPSLKAIAAQSAHRNDAIQRAYATTAYSLTEIAAHFGVHVSTVSRIARGIDGARNKT